MAQFFDIHPQDPQPRLLKQAAALLNKGLVLATPTDSGYALVCRLNDKQASDQLRAIRRLDDSHFLTLLCRDLSVLATYAKVDNRQFRLIRKATPGPFTFILTATKEVPKRVSHPSRKTIGLRVPDHVMLQALMQEYQAPLLSTTLILHGETEPLQDPLDIKKRLDNELGGVIACGLCPVNPTTVIDLMPMDVGDEPIIIRQGQGIFDFFQSI